MNGAFIARYEAVTASQNSGSEEAIGMAEESDSHGVHQTACRIRPERTPRSYTKPITFYELLGSAGLPGIPR
jgi:hypothetical protein